jgi:hypothetical protein
MIRRVLPACVALFFFVAGAAAAAPADKPQPPKYGPAGAPYAAPLGQSPGYFQSPEHPAPDFWALIAHYTGQDNDLSCSTAAVAMVLNAIAGTGGGLRAADQNFDPTRLAAEVRAVHWKERLSKRGWQGRRGLTLDELAEVTAAALTTYGLRDWKVSYRSFPAATPGALEELRAILAENEASADDFVILHFQQDILTDDPGGPYAHISPVGAYDAAAGRVLILDVDRKYYGPYWVGAGRLLRAVSATTPSHGRGGLVLVRKISR